MFLVALGVWTEGSAMDMDMDSLFVVTYTCP